MGMYMNVYIPIKTNKCQMIAVFCCTTKCEETKLFLSVV